MRPVFVTSLFFALILPVLTASLVDRHNCPAPVTCPPAKICPQFCSKCPRADNAGHPLQAEITGSPHYTRCRYQDTECDYGPGSTPNILAFSYPAGACPSVLGDNVCSDPLPPVQAVSSTTRCPDTNQAFVHTPVRSQPINSQGYTQCHYTNSECYYDGAGLLVDSLSIPKATPATSTQPAAPPGCRPALVESHIQNFF